MLSTGKGERSIMNILHTSDWHLGHTLYGRKRNEEFRLFLIWLQGILLKEKIDVLLVSGDIFDSGTPGTQAQALYYDFLNQAAASSCHVILTAGNHDSPSFLDAPQRLLEHLHVHTLGRARLPEEEVLEIAGPEGIPGVIICAVPFLRDRDLYRAEPGDSPETRDGKLAEGFREHYRRCAEAAERMRAGRDMPIIAMGHLFTQGGKVSEENAADVRVGSLARVDTDIFPKTFDYVALGHLHIPQKVKDQNRIRYSGSPLPMDFNEAGNRKSVCLIHTCGREISTEEIEIPCFQQMMSLRGDWSDLERQLQALSRSPDPLWIEVLYTGQEILGDLRERVLTAAPECVDVLRIRNTRQLPLSMHADGGEELTLEDMTESDVFMRCLHDAGLDTEATEGQCLALQELYDVIVREIKESSGENDRCAS